MDVILDGLPGCFGFDKEIVYGSTIEEHDTRLHVNFKRLQSNRLNVNFDECDFFET